MLKTLVLSITAILLSACNSPLLNHTNASERGQSSLNETPTDCQISLAEVNLCASWSWDRQPTENEMGTAALRFWDAALGTEAGPYVNPSKEVFVKLWMPSMGHGSSPVTTAAAKDTGGANIPGVYEASKIYFVMPGKWEIWVQLKDAGKLAAQGKLDYQL